MTSTSETPVVVTVNGERTELFIEQTARLSEALRGQLDLTGTKIGCDAGDCGACTVLVDNEPVCSCLVSVGALGGTAIESIEGLQGDPLGKSLATSFALSGAAQCGFCTPGMLMAATGLLRQNPNPSKAEVTEGLAGVLCRCTGYQKIVEAVMNHKTIEAPNPASIGKAVGHRLPRVDALGKVTGSESFGADDIPTDALTIQVVRSPYNRATFEIGDVDGFVAGQVSVEAVVTVKDIPGQNAFGVIPGFEDQPILADAQTRFLGEAVALIIGAGLDHTAIDHFPVTWEEQPAILRPDEAALPGADALHPHADDNVLVRGRVRRSETNSFEAPEVTVSGEFETSFVEHAYIEPEAGWARLDEGVLEIHVTTQAPYMDRDATAAILGLEPGQLRVVPTGCGGGFGGKLDISIQPLLGLATLVTGRPTSLVYTRPESMASTTKRHPAEMRATIGANGDGTGLRYEFDGTFNTGAYASWGPTVANRVPIHAGGPYALEHYVADTTAVYTNCAPAGAFRGFGVPQAAIARETLFDELAERLGEDKLEFREQHALRAGQPTVTGQVFESGVGMQDCLAALRTPWQEAKKRAAERNENSKVVRRGVGLAAAWYGCGNTALPNPSTVRIGLRGDGRIMLHQGATDIGQGSNTVMSQIAADALGVDVDAIVLIGPDTSLTPDAGKTSASRQTYVTGNATYLAAANLRDQILASAGISPEDRPDAELRQDSGGVAIVHGGQRYQPNPTASDGDGYLFVAEESYDPPTKPLDADGQGEPYAVFGFGAQLIEVDVDTQTGRTTVANVVAAYDVGRAINPAMVEGQIEGGVAQGLGLALMEEFLPGRPANLHDYLIPTMGDMPPVTSILIESTDPHGPYGAKGIGEHALLPTAPAILNAIRHATGAAVRRVPATPEVVLRAIDEAQE